MRPTLLVYGDVRRRADPHDEVARHLDAVDAARRLGPGLARHAALIAAGELVQGVADAAFRQTGRDAHEGATARLTGMLVWLAEHRVESWLAPPLAARLRVASPHTGPSRGCALP